MKKLIITAVIAAISSLYFVIDAERHLIFQTGEKSEEAARQGKNEVTPLGTDLVKIASENLSGAIKQATKSAKESLKDPEKGLAPDKAASSAIADIKEEARPGKLAEKASELISKAVGAITEIIKKPIEEKLDETFCSQK